MASRFAFCLLLAIAAGANAASSPDAQGPAEQAIANSIQSGTTADLTKLPEPRRTVRASFLEQIISQDSEANTHTISIIGAEIPDSLAVGQQGDSIDILPNVKLSECHFSDPVKCEGCNFHGSLSILRCGFDQGLDLSGSTVDGDLLLRGLTIRSGKDKAHALYLSNIHVGKKLSVVEPKVDGSIAASGITAAEVMITLTGSTLAQLNLGNLNADSVTISDSKPGSVHINGLSLAGATIKSFLILRNLTFKTLNLSTTTLNSFVWHLDESAKTLPWPHRMILDGLTFKSARISRPDNEQKEADDTLEFLNKAQYSHSAFQSLVDRFAERGQMPQADEVFFEMHRAQRRENFTLNPRTWPWGIVDCFQEYVLGYGRSLQAPLLWSLAFILYGWFLFRKRDYMNPTDDKAPTYSPVWYSLELFLPVVDLGMAKSWRPKESRLETYGRVHQIAGWILVPVALAAATGVVK
jgi:hypothetical protein